MKLFPDQKYDQFSQDNFHSVVGSIVWAFRRLKKPSCREMSSRSYALHSVHPTFLSSMRQSKKHESRARRIPYSPNSRSLKNVTKTLMHGPNIHWSQLPPPPSRDMRNLRSCLRVIPPILNPGCLLGTGNLLFIPAWRPIVKRVIRSNAHDLLHDNVVCDQWRARA